MGNVIPIQQVTVEDVRTRLRGALDGGLDAEAIADFVASVDWSGTDRGRPAIADILGRLEAWSTAYAEGDLTEAQYVNRLLGLLPAQEQRSIRQARAAS